MIIIIIVVIIIIVIIIITIIITAHGGRFMFVKLKHQIQKNLV